ncbi:aspartate aminotransferase, cytoplasmic-like [Cylas formicarius]|uniref:aspartate aminotransferase, cytoplasmic-like n=1 Tax=Cylas formicarius TaxID=197179 RepID=UPI0029589C6C|nr:aspartate aminotransferase, cytoplasmic-like [Cylas formicarius]
MFFGKRTPKNIQISNQLSNIKITVDLCYRLTSTVGLATGDPAEDAWPVRYFAQTGFELFCAQSFSINFGLADERVGNLTVILKCVKKIAAVRSQFDCIVRSIYFSPPSRGARIISYILQEDHLRHQWKENLQILAARLSFVRRRLREELEEMEAPGKWTHITDQVGLFCYTGLNECHVKHLIKHHHIYMYKSGALAVTGLTLNNVKYIANGIKETLLSIR